MLVRLAAEPYRVFTKEELLREVLGLQVARADADSRLARVAPSAQAPGGRAGTFRHQRLAGRLQASRLNADLAFALSLADEADALTLQRYRAADLGVETRTT